MKNRLLALLPAALLAAAQALAAPATSNVRGAEYPAVNPDRSVTFQVKAPTAQKVQVQPGAAACVALMRFAAAVIPFGCCRLVAHLRMRYSA